jgi:hypothetical protein
MSRMESLRERVARAMFFGEMEDDGGDVGSYWQDRADEVLAALGLDEDGENALTPRWWVEEALDLAGSAPHTAANAAAYRKLTRPATEEGES